MTIVHAAIELNPENWPRFRGGPANDDLRRQMLSTIFGWNKEIEELIRDEISRHPAGSTSRMLLAKWLGDITDDVMVPTSEMTSADWMKLALLGMSGNSQQSQLGRAYIPKLLETGDVHTAVTMLIGYSDYNDAIEIYVSHKRYMEALILTCLFYPGVWERQEQIIKKWGEWLVQHGQQQLAIRWYVCRIQHYNIHILTMTQFCLHRQGIVRAMDFAVCCSNQLPEHLGKYSGTAQSATIAAAHEPWPTAQCGQVLVTQAHYLLRRPECKIQVLLGRRYGNSHRCWSYTNRRVGDEVGRWI